MSIDETRGLFYDPPYDSPIEDLFAWNAHKYMDKSVRFQKQVETKTICGRFYIDFVAAHNQKIAFECDGREYHTARRDMWRDAMLLGSGAVDVVYHLRGADLNRHIEDCFYEISLRHPNLFSERGRANLEKLASEEAHSDLAATGVICYDGSRRNRYSEEDEYEEMSEVDDGPSEYSRPHYVVITRHTLSDLSELYNYAMRSGGGNLDQIIECYHQRNH